METVKKLEQAARRLAKCVDYVGAATVEYLYSMETGEYYFLELNPRLQVCHSGLTLKVGCYWIFALPYVATSNSGITVGSLCCLFTSLRQFEHLWLDNS